MGILELLSLVIRQQLENKHILHQQLAGYILRGYLRMGFEKKFTMPWILPLELQRYAQVSWNGFHILSEHPLNYRCNGFALACIQFLCLDSAWTEINQALAISVPLLIFWISRTAWKTGGGGQTLFKNLPRRSFPTQAKGEHKRKHSTTNLPSLPPFQSTSHAVSLWEIYDKRPVNISSPKFEFL